MLSPNKIEKEHINYPSLCKENIIPLGSFYQL